MLRLAALLLLLTACTYRGALPGAHGDGVHSVLVVDDRTGRPLPGVRVRVFREEARNDASTAPYVAQHRTDPHGLLSLPIDERTFDCHWVFEHPGYAPVDDYPCETAVIRMRTGRTVSGRLLDAHGRPARETGLEYFVGCPHSPSVRRVTTDALGRFRLDDVDPWEGRFRAPGSRAEKFHPHPGVAPVPGFRLDPIGEVRARLPERRVRIDPPGDPQEFEFWIDAEDRSRGRILRTRRAGRVLLQFEHAEFGYGAIPVDLDALEVAVRPGAFPPLRTLVALDAAGRRLGDLRVEVFGRRGWREVPRTSWMLQPGVWLRVRRDAPGHLPIYRLFRDTPLVWGGASLELRVDPGTFVCILDGELLAGEELLVVRGLDRGRHKLLVGARGHRTRVVRLVLGARETRRMEIALDPIS